MKMKSIFLVFLLALTSSCGERGYLYEDVKPLADSYSGSFSVVEGRVSSGDLDILWVIDNSGSMGTHQQSVIKNTALFVQEFTKRKDIDWKLGLISTDTADGPKAGFVQELKGSDPNVVPVFQQAVKDLGTGGDATEKVFLPTVQALKKYPNFLRKDAYLVLIIVTDAYDQSPGYDAQRFLNELVAYKGSADKIKVYAAIGSDDFPLPNGVKCSAENEKPFYGQEFDKLIQATGGSAFPICSPDFGQQLSQIAVNIIKLIKNPSIYLSARPISTSIKVKYKGKELPGGDESSGGMWYYDYSSNAVVFYNLDFANDVKDKIDINFTEDNGFN